MHVADDLRTILPNAIEDQVVSDRKVSDAFGDVFACHALIWIGGKRLTFCIQNFKQMSAACGL